MKKTNIIYWTTTGIVGAMMMFTALNYLTNEEMKNAFVHLGFPSYLRIELAVAKIIGALILVIPIFRKLIKVAAYAGFTIVFVSAFVAHTAIGDPAKAAIMPLIFLGILLVSYIYYIKLKSE